MCLAQCKIFNKALSYLKKSMPENLYNYKNQTNLHFMKKFNTYFLNLNPTL